jgi:hypothetical protein
MDMPWALARLPRQIYQKRYICQQLDPRAGDPCPIGDAMPKTILDEKKIAKMIELRTRGVALKNIAVQFGVSMARVSEVLLERDLEKNNRTPANKW